MKVPNADKAVVTESKIKDYLLSYTHERGRHKAAFLALFGFNVDNWQELDNRLKGHIRAYDFTSTTENRFGTRYTVEGEIDTPSGRWVRIRTVWFIDKNEETPRFVSAYPRSL